MKTTLVICICTFLFSFVSSQNVYSYPDFNPSNINDFQLNGEAVTMARSVSSTHRLGLSAARQSTAGSAFLKNSIPLTGSDGFKADFSTFFSFIIENGFGSDGTGQGADGLVFVVNSLTSQVGSVGQGIGYQGLQRSIGVEFDTWYNPGIDNDGNHVGINVNGEVSAVKVAYYPVLMNDQRTHYVWIDYNGVNQILEVRMAEVAVRPVNPILTRNLDLAAILQTPNVYVGFTSATGGSYNNHYISSWTFTNSYAPIVVPPTTPTAVCGNNVVEAGEACDDNGPCCSACAFRSSSTVCRGSSGSCDVAETCTGSSSSCPADSFASATTVCRPSVGVCDLAETCTGSSSSCPADSFASTTTVCRPSVGVCDVAESCTGSSSSCPMDSFSPSTTVCRESLSTCDPQETCTGSNAQCPIDRSGDFETACAGLALPLHGSVYSFMDFGVISFGNFSANSGDVEARLAVKRDITLGSGYSVGYEIRDGNDRFVPYSLVAGRDVSWTSGAVYPDGSGRPYAAPQEDMFVGRSFTGPDYLRDRVAASCETEGCLNSYFDAVQQCYNGYQSTMASQADNVNKEIKWSGLFVTCNDPSAKNYYLSLTPAEMSQYSYTSLTACNRDARWTINIRGSEDVAFRGGSFPADASNVVYNVIGQRQISVSGVQVDGHLIAPNSVLNQESGVIIGKVVAADVKMSLQINKHQCFTSF